MVQWLRICALMQRRWVCFPVREDPTCHGATKPCTTTTEVTCCSYEARISRACAPQQEKPALSAPRESPHTAGKNQCSQN